VTIGITCLIILTLFVLNIPIAFSLILGVLFYFLMQDAVPIMILSQRLISGIQSIPLLAIPFFVVAGIMMNYTGITKRLVRFSEIITGRLPGGLAQVTIVLSTIMGGLSGSSLADAAMQTKILYPSMRKNGYSAGFSTAIIGASANITPLIPPGIAMILYGYIGNVSIGRLFMAGVIPGLLTCLVLMVTVHFIAKKKDYKPLRIERVKPKEAVFATKDAFLALLLPVAIIGGIRIGIFTPSEAGAMAIVYALVLGVVFYREMKLHHFKSVFTESTETIASVMLIIAAGSAFGWILTWERVPQMATEYVTGIVDSPLLFLVIINLFLLFLGMFLEGNVAIIILTPLLIPMAEAFNIDPVHFGMIFLFNLAIGTLTPPMGTIIFTTCQVAGVKVEEFIKGVVPFYLALIAVLILITYIPGISLWLPNLLMK
jgi:tripartite ATP-independent transporter DctM subunit